MTARRIVLRGRGHEQIRASHGKTLEFTPEQNIGAGGTCVVGVAATSTGAALAGAVHCTLAAAGEQVEFGAVANPGWDPTGRAVLRRSDVRQPDTLATHATLTAADLSRALVAALADPKTDVVLTVTPASPQPPRLVVVAAGEPAHAERAAADVVTSTPPASVDRRVLLLGRPVTLASAPMPVEVYGVAVHEAVAVAAGTSVLGDLHSLADPGLRDTAVVLRVPASELDKMCRAAQRHGRRSAALIARLPWLVHGALDALVAPAGARTLWLCLDPVPVANLDERIAALRAGGAATKEIARILADELGLPAKHVYERVLNS